MSTDFEWVAGELCLDFHNTVSWDPGDPSRSDGFREYGDLVGWAEGSWLIPPERAAELRADAGRRREEAQRALGRARTLRANLHALFMALAEGGRPAQPDLQHFNDVLGEISLKIQFAPEQQWFEWDWTCDVGDLTQFLWPVVWSAASLLHSEDLGHVRMCASDRCGWLFLDQSRRRNRKWCAMKDCGNKAKAKRYYHRHRKAES